ncbi:Zn-dependent exopeptidase [Thozetella sp. PMI_491]|nr:Zn-dependent exopeptidase [Thozetella sp. PMI_491]
MTKAWGQEAVEQFMLDTPQIDKLRHWSRLYSSDSHLAGDLAHAESIRDLWLSYGIPTELVRYDVLQNFPIGSSLRLHGRGSEDSVAFTASLTEDELPEDPTSAPPNSLPAFHGFSANGNVCAELVYANFGTIGDFQLMKARGVSVEGKIVICKYGKVFRGLKVRAAEQFGAAGVVMYNDPQEDGEYTAKNGYQHYPHGPARHPKSIQRGSVDFFSVAVGDPSTPGYPSLPGDETKRLDPTHAIPTIPSLPISFADATPFLLALNGCGLSPDEIGGSGADWKGEIDGVNYYTGPSRVKVSLYNEGEYRYAPIYNVIGTVSGETDECIVLGNHHDSWCPGAVDPVSGSAAINEVARGLGVLVSQGWKPYRKIILASWDNEEYGLVGSTEWGEHNAQFLSRNCVAYINVDESTNGGNVLGATGSPLLDSVLRDITHKVPSPVNEGKLVFDDWLSDQQRGNPNVKQPLLDLMGTGSDYTVFFDHLGIPSVDMIFNRQGTSVYPYHSNYDSYYWLEHFGDVGFKKHRAMAQIFGLLAVRLAGVHLIQFEAGSYSESLQRHLATLKLKEAGRSLDWQPLEDAIVAFDKAAQNLDARACALKAMDAQVRDEAEIVEVNKQYINLERSFLLDKNGGLPGRPWYRHMIFAPGLWYGYDGVAFPGVLESLEKNDIEGANQWLGTVATALEKASSIISSR